MGAHQGTPSGARAAFPRPFAQSRLEHPRDGTTHAEGSMAASPTPGTGGQGTSWGLIAQVRVGMEVHDSLGEHIGKVTDIRLGDPDAIDIGRGDASMPGEGFAVASGLVGRMLLNGSIKVDDKRRLRADHHYYAM